MNCRPSRWRMRPIGARRTADKSVYEAGSFAISTHVLVIRLISSPTFSRWSGKAAAGVIFLEFIRRLTLVRCCRLFCRRRVSLRVGWRYVAHLGYKLARHTAQPLRYANATAQILAFSLEMLGRGTGIRTRRCAAKAEYQMSDGSQTKTENGSGRNQQQKDRPGNPASAKTGKATDKATEKTNGGAHPRNVKNR